MQNWWGKFTFAEYQARYWEIGQTLLCIEHHKAEWRIATKALSEEKANATVNVTEIPNINKEALNFKRFVFHRTDPTITITPVMADRAQVSRAETAFYLPADEHVTIYVTSPAWVRIDAGEPGALLDEVPTMRLSDTWYGPNTREGELCYANHTFCRTDLTDVVLSSHRVISPVLIYNRSKNTLLLEEVTLPHLSLSVYADEDGNLWSEEVIIRYEGDEVSTIKQGRGAPSIIPYATLISKPRTPLKSNTFSNIFHSLLGK